MNELRAEPFATTAAIDAAASPAGAALPARLGRYEVSGVLGEGGYGVVYRGYDPELRRVVAIKVPRRERVESPT